jgi:formyltetrahydrofolate deformylase
MCVLDSVRAGATIENSIGRYVLIATCPDTVGVVAAVTGCLARHEMLITEAQHFLDPVTNSSILRVVFSPNSAVAENMESLRSDFASVADRFAMNWQIHDASKKPRMLVAVSKAKHCLNSLLRRWETGTLPIDVVGVVSNHEDCRRLAEWHGLTFYYLPIEQGGKQRQESLLLDLIDDLEIDLFVMARHMQVLSHEACEKLAGRAINIHHLFLPSFRGARPYHQA